MQWIGERFIGRDGVWLDLATGRRVRVLFTGVDAANAAEWDEQCARLAAARHPLLNSLIDWGPAPAGHRFEAYDRAPDVRGSSAPPALDHLARFLRASGIVLPASRALHAIRSMTASTRRALKPVGITLQRRRALDVIEEALDSAEHAGAAVVEVTAPSRMGLRTLCVLAARSARLRGYVPLNAAAARQVDGLASMLRDSHVCVLECPDDRDGHPAALRDVVRALSSSSIRRHVVLRFRREPPHRGTRIVLAPMPLSSLIGMVYVDPENGPAEGDLFSAARDADGRPGLLVSALSGECGESRHMAVHESRAAYGTEAVALPAPPAIVAGRVLGSALRAAERGVALARSGRHAAAARVLSRGFRVLTGRQRYGAAAACAWHLGTLSLDRGRTEAAVEYFERGYKLAPEDHAGLRCGVGLGAALVDAGRPLDAEAVLRGAAVLADTHPDTATRGLVAAALARALYWQARYEEGLAVMAPFSAESTLDVRTRGNVVISRCHARLGMTAAAVRSARAAQHDAMRSDDPRLKASAELTLASALFTAGDAEAGRAALARARRVARTAHLPLVRARALLVQVESGDASDTASALRTLRRMRLTGLLAQRCEAIERDGPRAARAEPVAELESLLDISQRSADDRSALAAIVSALAERLRAATVAVVARDERVLAVEGRRLTPAPVRLREVIACGTRIGPDGRNEPQEAIEPVRYSGEVVGAIVCRWTAGTLLDPDRVAIPTRAAAMVLGAHVRALVEEPAAAAPAGWVDLIGTSEAAAAIREAAARAARAPFPVLIDGESGSGKELVARAIHRLGSRRDRKFCALNCAALSDELVEAELFGHARGAFTGAAAERPGLFEEADGGTLFLDEVGELSPRAQAKLLRVLQEGEVRRVGENFSRRVDVRIVAATNRRLEQEVESGRFRADLRFRLDVVRISVPALRERVADIPLLAAHFWRDASARVGSQATLSGDALAALSRYDWPGNVRELQNVVAWMAVHSPRRGRVGAQGLPHHIARSSSPSTALRTLEAAREEFERRFVRAALATAQGQRTKAAGALGISRQGLAKLMRRLQIEAP